MNVRIGTSTDRVELECAEVEGAHSPASGDLLLVVSVQCGDFVGRVDAWVDKKAWSEFIKWMRDLDRLRQGTATLESISPGELRLIVQSTDRAGHMAVHGLIGVRSGAREIRLEFSPISFDPSDLPEIVRQMSMFGTS